MKKVDSLSFVTTFLFLFLITPVVAKELTMSKVLLENLPASIDVRRIDILNDNTLWISTSDGLYLADGHRVKEIQLESESSKSTDLTKEGKKVIVNSGFTGVVQTIDNDVLISYETGVSYLLQNNGASKSLPLREHGLYPQVWGLDYFPEHQLFVTAGANAILFAFDDLSNLNGIVFERNLNKNHKNEYFAPISFELMSKSELIVGFSEGGMGILNTVTKEITHIKSSFNILYDIEKIAPEKYLLATDGGLFIFNETDRTINNVKNFEEPVRVIKKYGSNRYLLAGKGLFSYDFKTIDRVGYFDDVSAQRAQITAMNIDKEMNVWVAVEGFGIYNYAPSNKKLSFKSTNVLFNQSFSKKITDVIVAENRIVLTSGQYVFDMNENGTVGNTFNAGASVNVEKVYYDNTNFWAASSERLYKLNSDLQLIDSYPVNWKNGVNITNVSSLFLDSNKKVWISGHGFDNSQMMNAEAISGFQFDIYNQNDPLRSHRADEHFIIQFDNQSKILVFNAGDFYSIYDLMTGNVLHDERKLKVGTRHISKKTNAFVNNYKMYKAASKGLFYYTTWDADTNKLAPFTKLQTPVNNAQCLIETDPGEYWLAQKNGSVFYWNSHTDELVEYDTADGSSAAGLTGKSCVEHEETGKLYFAANDGVVIVDPSNIATNSVQPNVYIENIQISEQDIESGQSKDRSLLDSEIEVQHNQSISFQFRIDSFAVPSENRLKTRLRGISDWVEKPASQNEQSFAQLASGTYVFEVMGSNNDGVWSEPKQLTFVILPPWYRSTIAFILYGLLLVITMVLFFRFRTKQLQQRAKQLQLEVQQRTEELAEEKHVVESLLEQKNNEFANVSHEFRTPLTLILGPINKLINQTKSGKDQKILSMVQRNTQRLVRMVDQILHLERHKLKQVTEIVTQDVSGTLNLIYHSFVSLTEDKALEFKLEVEDNLYVDMAIDSLDKIVINLVSNAIKYTPRGGKIALKAWQKDHQVYISVIDTGFGIAEDMQEEVFNKFSRVLDEHSEKITGAGIGLALVKELVVSQKGHISLNSTIGTGSEFLVTFPASVKQASAKAKVNTDFIDYEVSNLVDSYKITQQDEAYQEVDADSQNKPLVLVVEDNPDMREYIVSNLSLDYRCIEAANGRLGVEKAIEQVPDLIISDVMMPEMDGFELSNTIKTNPLTSHIPLILLTARGDKKSRIRGWREHADEYLTKPFDADELLIRIHNLLTIRDMISQRYHQQFFTQQASLHSAAEGKSIENAQLVEDAQLGENKPFVENEFSTMLQEKLESLYQDHEVTIENIAAALSCSNRQFQRKISGLMNVTPSQMLREFRLAKSVELLQQGHKPNMVYLEAGFSSHSYFSRCFKARYDCSPSEFA
jgi:signal transduction histidine kinase/DNA-binding response OmpR family regulator/ligand-binding sensor domain-containing protein